MTATVPRTGLRTHLRRAARAAAATLAITAMVLPASASWADTTEEPEEAEAITVDLAPTGGGVLSEGETAHAKVTIVNSTGDTLSEARAVLELGRTPLASSAALAAWLASGTASGGFGVIDSTPTDAVAAGEELTIDLFAGPDQLGEPASGVYPLRAQITGATTGPDDALVHHSLDARSVVLFTGVERSVALLVPITLTPVDGGLLTAEELAEATGPEGVLTAQLEALSGSAAILAVDPAIPAAIRALGEAAPASAASWLTALEALPNERFALQFADADATAQAQAGLDAPLDAPGLTSYLDPADFAAADDDLDDTSPGESEEVALPTLDELTGIRNSTPGLLWPRGGVDTEDLAAFADFFGPDTTTVLPSSASTGTAPPALADVDGHRVLIHDSSASAALSRAISESDAAPRSSALADAIAHIALAETPGTVLLALERDEGRTVDALRDAMDALEELATPVTLSELLAEEPAPTGIDTVDDPARADALREMLAEEQDLVAFSSILEDPAVLTDLERIRLLQVIGVGEPEGGFVAAVAAHRERTAGILSSVGIQPSSDVQILSAAVDLPVWVHNELPWPITVTLGARPADPRLEVQAQTTVESIPMNNTRVRVPVQARVGSGEVDVHLHLTSPTGVLIGEPQVTHVIVRAEWESIGLVVLGVGVGLLLVLGVIRTVRRRRKADAAASDSVPQGDDG